MKGFADAMGLGVAARNRPEGGAAFELAWPASALRRVGNGTEQG